MCLLPPLRAGSPHPFSRTVTGRGRWSDGANWPVSAAWVHERLGKVGAAPPIYPADAPFPGANAVEWGEWWSQTRMVPPEAWRQLRKIHVHTDLARGLPITDLPYLDGKADEVVGKYPDGQVFRYKDLPALSGSSLVFRLDWLHLSGSVAVVPHEAAHSLNLFVWGRLDDAPEWREIHRRCRWPDPYTHAHPDEALCEAFAFQASGMIAHLDAPVQDYMGRLWSRFGYTRWPQGY